MDTINKFGFNWRVGRNWGIAHPEHICYNNPISIHEGNNYIGLGIDRKPAYIPIDGYTNPEDPDMGNTKFYPWSVGYLSTIETIKYGYIRVEFKLPIGMHVWPAIWLTDGKTWPPEVDIVEGWTGQYNWPILKPKSARRLYRVNPLANRIFPGVHLGTSPKDHWGKSYTKFRGTSPCYLNIPGINNCELIWTPDRLIAYYNGHKVMDESDPEILKYFNDSEGMEIHLNNYISNDFTINDYIEMIQKPEKDYCKWFYIYDVQYNPDYKQYLIGVK